MGSQLDPPLGRDQDIENGPERYRRGRFPSQYKQSTFSSALRNHIATSLT
jgi:hypothetical protein